MLARLFSLLFNGILVFLVLASVIPGTHRIVFPASFGLTEIDPGTWTDAPHRADELRALTGNARNNVADFFGDAWRKPNLVLCTTRNCARNFGIGGNGLSVPRLGIFVSPGGLTEGTLTHEMTHFRLHRRFGPRNILAQPFPTWFDEGLATHVANHPSWRGTVTDTARARIRKVQRFWQWDDAYRALGVGQAYGTAGAEVARIEARAGRDGLLDLIARAEAGEDFVRLLAEITPR